MVNREPAVEGFDGLLGLEVIELSDERARGRVVVRGELTQGAGAVHGGVYAAVAESLATMATLRSARAADVLAQQTSLVRAVKDGTIEAVATRKHRGRTTWVWEVECADGGGQLCALTRVTLAIRQA